MPTPRAGLAGQVHAFTTRFPPAVVDADGEARRRAHIMEVTLQVAAADGAKGASLRQIAARTGIRTASLYTYFPGGKSELVSTALAESLRGFYRIAAAALRADEAPSENVRRLVFAHTRWTLENPTVAPAILVLERAHAMRPIMTPDMGRAIQQLHDAYRTLLCDLLVASGSATEDADRLAALVIVLCDNADAWLVPGTADQAQEHAWLAVRRMLGWSTPTAGVRRPAGRQV